MGGRARVVHGGQAAAEGLGQPGTAPALLHPGQHEQPRVVPGSSATARTSGTASAPACASQARPAASAA